MNSRSGSDVDMRRNDKRKRGPSPEDREVVDLSDVRTDEDARQHQHSSPSQNQATSLLLASSAAGVQQRDTEQDAVDGPRRKKAAATIDLDLVPDPMQDTIEIDSEDDDERNVVHLDEYALHEYVGTFHSKAVGIRFYHGRVTTSESVLLRREPNNAYDRNAIQVLNVNGQQVGHLPAVVASGLAPWLDNNLCLVEASVKSKALVHSIPLTVDVFAHASFVSQIPTALARSGIQLDKSRGSRGASQTTSQANIINLDEIQAGSTAVNVRQATALLDELTVNVKDLESMKQAIQPVRLCTMLLGYQLQGLRWMIEKENPQLPKGSETVQMWKRIKNTGSYFNVATNFKLDEPPVLGSGGLLSDDMGLGKTLQVLALVVAGQDSAPDIKLLDVTNLSSRSKATLVICPTSLMSNWIDQATQHVGSDKPLDTERYHGKSKSTAQQLARKELVVTTYGTLTSEWSNLPKDKRKVKQGLFAVQWKRIVLDEAHKIRNPKSQASLAVHDLKGERRWCLTGTPVINNYNDLGSLLRFVRWTGGIESPQIFNSKITRKLLSPGQDVQKEAVKLIKVLMQDLSLRRRKDLKYGGKSLIELPKITEYHHKLKFSSNEELETYAKLAQQARGTLISKSRDRQSQVLEILLRMRQACCARGLISEDRLALLQKLDDLQTVEFTEENKLLLFNYLSLAVEASEDCPICLDCLTDQIKTPVITYCKHVFCRDCILSCIAGKASCPLCRAPLKESQILELPAPVDPTQSDKPDPPDFTSTKIEGLLQVLSATHRQDPSNKTVVFSQWTKLLDLIERQLPSLDMPFCRIDGSMSLPRRDAAVEALQNGDASIMLASLAVASVGLNLTSANVVILMDPWWSPAIEDQAVDRVYRLGQKREVTVYKMVIEDSVEEKVLEIQQRKRQMTATIGARQSRAQETEMRRADLEALLGG